MTDKKILQIRKIIAIASFFVLSGTLLPFLKGLSLRSENLIVSLLLLLSSFAILANGVSFLSEIFKKQRNLLKIFTALLSLMIFVFVLFPQDQDTSQIIGWTIIIGLSFSAILIPVFSLFEFTHEFAIMKVYSFVFSLFSGIYSFCIFSFIFRGYNHSEAAVAFMIYGVIIFVISMIVNLFTVSSLNNGIRGNL